MSFNIFCHLKLTVFFFLTSNFYSLTILTCNITPVRDDLKENDAEIGLCVLDKIKKKKVMNLIAREIQ